MEELAMAVPDICRLQHLTRLQMRPQGPYGDAEPPPNGLADLITSLPRLQLLDWCCWDDGQSLPAGPALASLRRLHVPVQVLARSLPALSQATQLEALMLSPRSAGDGDDSGALCAVLRWAPQQPALRLVSLALELVPVGLAQPDTVSAPVLNAALEAQRLQPALHIGAGVKVFEYADDDSDDD